MIIASWYHQGDFTTGKWEEKSENVSFANFSFIISEHRLRMEGEEDEDEEKEESEREDEGGGGGGGGSRSEDDDGLCSPSKFHHSVED